jgi:hypothetical protein
MVSEAPGAQIKCTGMGGTGSLYKSGTEGSATLRYTGCKVIHTTLEYTCTTPGSSAGNITTKTLQSAPVYLDAAKTKFGFKLTPLTGNTFAEFTCGPKEWKWTGSFLGQITSPALNVLAYSFELSFGTGGLFKQQFEQIEGSGTKWHLSQQVGGGFVEPVALLHTINAYMDEGTSVTFVP